MKIEKKVALKWGGVGLLILTLVANVQLALLDYGLGMNNLSYELIAQTNGGTTNGSSSNGGSSSGENSNGDGTNGGSSSVAVTTLWIRKDDNCTYTFYGKAGADVTIFGGTVIKIGANGYAMFVLPYGKTDCTAGGADQCTARYCPSPF
ncbi:hypothetical protein [Arcticibacter tournemirensis]|uniref:Uncharacterized protein n=1 Tax=Arcticibacter tournemirensis TaxID=699437 RepID=A0A4Q0MEG8_9SPHI|nr:hypothetical protein [Arcticibacter tournemirensis]RXF71828.1 hypothetical protein EKH83_03845 [Arcticibacter tournemirensis]